MNAAFDMVDALDAPLKERPLFPVEPKDRDPASELDRQVSLDSLLRVVGPSITSWAVVNAAKRGLKAQRQAKREGLTAGVFDKHYAWNHGLAFLEWKDGTGSLSQAQIDWGNLMHRLGFRVACVRSAKFAHALFVSWGAPVRAIS
ncbi:hypothetical protein [Sphingomonas sp.]|uniref:hypothetical protein n=1 Tax=Sphingomonas sp. TaxID=28214 RepID=UPI0025F66C6D|nr:hypothetical protein [Sphingomonas sp.]